MDELVFATVLTELKKAWNDIISDPDLIELLYDAVAEPVGLSNKNGDTFTVSKTTASKIVNRRQGGNPLKAIRKASDDKRVLSSIDKFFETRVLKYLLEGSKDNLIQHLKDVIEQDASIAQAKKDELLKLAQKNTLAQFLASVYLYSLIPDNVSANAEAKKMNGTELENYKKNPLPALQIPESIKAEERKYAAALFEVYGQLEQKRDFTVFDLKSYPQHKAHFETQRGFYYAAEAVRRGTRDIYTKKDADQFEILKSEVLEGVREVWEDDYKNGITRLRKVLTQAGLVPVAQCWLSKDTYWIGIPQKKGVCHFLVKDGSLEGWARDDDGQVI